MQWPLTLLHPGHGPQPSALGLLSSHGCAVKGAHKSTRISYCAPLRSRGMSIQSQPTQREFSSFAITSHPTFPTAWRDTRASHIPVPISCHFLPGLRALLVTLRFSELSKQPCHPYSTVYPWEPDATTSEIIVRHRGQKGLAEQLWHSDRDSAE